MLRGEQASYRFGSHPSIFGHISRTKSDTKHLDRPKRAGVTSATTATAFPQTTASAEIPLAELGIRAPRG